MTDLEKALYPHLSTSPQCTRVLAVLADRKPSAVSSRLAIMANKGWVRRVTIDDIACFAKTEKLVEAWSKETGETFVLSEAGQAVKRMQSNKLSKLGNGLCERAFNSGVAL